MGYEKEQSGWTGWVVFAAAVMMAEGVIQFLYGLGAIFHQTWLLYTANATYLFDSTTWGWTLLILGSLIFLSGLLLLSGNWFGRTMGVLLATLGLIANVGILGAAPLWAILGIALNVVVLYAILAHGSELKPHNTGHPA